MSFHHHLIFLQGNHLYLSFLQQPFVFPDSSLPPRHDSFFRSAAESLNGARGDRWQRMVRGLRKALVAALPVVIRALGIIGTIAMLLVGGGMYTHNIEMVHHALEFMPSLSAELLLGLVVGGIVLGTQLLVRRIIPKGA